MPTSVHTFAFFWHLIICSSRPPRIRLLYLHILTRTSTFTKTHSFRSRSRILTADFQPFTTSFPELLLRVRKGNLITQTSRNFNYRVQRSCSSTKEKIGIKFRSFSFALSYKKKLLRTLIKSRCQTNYLAVNSAHFCARRFPYQSFFSTSKKNAYFQ